MKIRQPIRTSQIGSRKQKRVFDLVIEDGNMLLEIKQGDTTIEIEWEKVVSQVESILNNR